ncbi:MAG: sigma factor-like helix-turn-helix DNA-binding protein [Bryobacteraceae bacterium]
MAGFDPRKAQIVELRYFGGMSVEETADVLGVHPNTVMPTVLHCPVYAGLATCMR